MKGFCYPTSFCIFSILLLSLVFGSVPDTALPVPPETTGSVAQANSPPLDPVNSVSAIPGFLGSIAHDNLGVLDTVLLVFRNMIKSLKPGMVNLFGLFKGEEDSSMKILAFSILVSIVKTNPSFFTLQFDKLCDEGNKQFEDFINKPMLVDLEGATPQAGEVSTLKNFLIEEGLFEFILNRRKISLVNLILKEVENLAVRVIPKRADRIKNFLEEFPLLEREESKYNHILYLAICRGSIKRTGAFSKFFANNAKSENDFMRLKIFQKRCGQDKYEGITNFLTTEMSYGREELNLFEELVNYLFDEKNTETISFFGNPIVVNNLKKFLGITADDDLIITDLLNKGLFFIIANHFNDKRVKKIRRILDSRMGAIHQLEKNRTGRFWASLSAIRNDKSIDRLGLILLRNSFCSFIRSKSYYSKVSREDAEFINNFENDTLSGVAELDNWENEFFGFNLPSYVPKSDEIDTLNRLHNFGLSEDEVFYNAIGHALYFSFVEKQFFSTTFTHIMEKSTYKPSFKDEELKEIEKITQMVTPIEVYLALKRIPNHGGQAINFFFQYIALYKSNDKMKDFKRLIKTMPPEFENAPNEWVKYGDRYTPGASSRIVRTLAFALWNEKFTQEKDEKEKYVFISKLPLDILTIVVKWLKKLAKDAFYNKNITVENLQGNPLSVELVLNNLGVGKAK
jgi:hypothetical protein